MDWSRPPADHASDAAGGAVSDFEKDLLLKLSSQAINAPWVVVDANNKKEARLNVIHHLLSVIPYGELTHEDIELPPRQQRAYTRPPIDSQTWVTKQFVVK